MKVSKRCQYALRALIDMGIAFGAMAIFVIHQLWTLRRRPDDPPPPDDEPL